MNNAVGFKKDEMHTILTQSETKQYYLATSVKHTLLSVLLLAAATLGTQRSRGIDMFDRALYRPTRGSRDLLKYSRGHVARQQVREITKAGNS